MKTLNNLIPIGKEESCQTVGGRGQAMAESIGRGAGRFARRFCIFMKEVMRSGDYVWRR